MSPRNHLPLVLAVTLSFVHAATAQAPTDPPPSQHPILTLTGKGVQIYVCQQAATGPQWVFQAPEADLADTAGKPAGTHNAGPTWNYTDGSSVKGEVLQKSPSPDPDAMPWLLLKAVSTSGSGILTKVEFIRRFDTHGGISPVTGCDAHHLNEVTRVPYTSTYTFYSAKP